MNHILSQPLSCATATEWIHLLLDHALAPEQNEKLNAHLQTCERCRTLQQELQQLEAAHVELAAQTLAPPENYFADLPERVLARIAAEEQPAPAVERIYARKPRAFNLWDFVWGRGRIAIAFAAMLALVFLVTQQLRENEAPQTLRREAVQSTSSEESATSSRVRAPSIAQSDRASDSVMAISPRSAQTGKAKSESAVSNLNKEEFAPAAQAESAAPTQNFPAVAADNLEPRALALPSDTLVSALLAVTQPQRAAEFEAKTQALTRQVEEARSFAEQPAVEHKRMARVSSSSDMAAAKPQSQSANFVDALAEATRTKNEAERLKIWQRYLRFDRNDSASYNSKVENIARLLAAQADSNAAPARLQEAIIFYETMQPVLVMRWGSEKFAREKTRMEGLLNWKTGTKR